MSAGLRDQRIRVFSYSDTSADGRMSSGYAYIGEYWGRIEAPSGRERTTAGQAEQEVDAVITLNINAPVTLDGLVKGPDGKAYKVSAVLPRRMLQELEVYAVYADDSTMTLTGEP